VTTGRARARLPLSSPASCAFRRSSTLLVQPIYLSGLYDRGHHRAGRDPCNTRSAGTAAFWLADHGAGLPNRQTASGLSEPSSAARPGRPRAISGSVRTYCLRYGRHWVCSCWPSRSRS